MLGGRREREVVVSSRLRPHKVHERRTPPPAFNTHTHHPLHPNSLDLLIQRGLQVGRKRRPRERLRARRRFGLHGGQLGLDFVEGLEHQAGQLVGGGGRGVAAGGGSAARGDAGRGSEGREEWREGVSSQSSCHTAGELGSPVVCKGPASCALVFCFFRRRRAVWATTGKKKRCTALSFRRPLPSPPRHDTAASRVVSTWGGRRTEGAGGNAHGPQATEMPPKTQTSAHDQTLAQRAFTSHTPGRRPEGALGQHWGREKGGGGRGLEGRETKAPKESVG